MPDLLTLDKFSGLRLDVDPLEVGFDGSLRHEDLVLGREGVLRTRAGTTAHLDGGSSGDGDYYRLDLLELSTGVETLFPWRQDSATGNVGVVGNTTLLAAAPNGAVAYTTPAGTAGYFLGTPAAGGCKLYKYVGGVWSTAEDFVGVITYPMGLTVTPWDKRMVALDQSPGTVRFSDPGDPTTWDSSNYIQMEDMDAAGLTACCTFQGQVFVFSANRFWVFYGTSTDSTGGAVFNYRSVDAGVGAPAPGASTSAAEVATTPFGVFFVNERGLWRTTGGLPTEVSRAVRPLFEGRTLYGNVAVDSPTRCFWDGTHVVIPASGQSLLYRPDLDVWGTDSRQLDWLRPKRTGGERDSYFIDGTGSGHLGRYVRLWDDDATDDVDVAIPWKYRSGLVTPAPSRRVVAKDLMLEGSGSLNAKALTGNEEPADPYTTTTLTPTGTNTAASARVSTPAGRGSAVSFYFASSDSLDATELRRASTLLTPGGPVGVGIGQ